MHQYCVTCIWAYLLPWTNFGTCLEPFFSLPYLLFSLVCPFCMHFACWCHTEHKGTPRHLCIGLCACHSWRWFGLYTLLTAFNWGCLTTPASCCHHCLSLALFSLIQSFLSPHRASLVPPSHLSSLFFPIVVLPFLPLFVWDFFFFFASFAFDADRNCFQHMQN